MPINKSDVIASCFNYLDKQIQDLKDQISHLQQAIAEDTKSSAGDKYETSREMAQSEINKLLSLQYQHQQNTQLLQRYKQQEGSVSAQLGSLVVTTSGLTLYIIASLGRLQVNNSDSETIEVLVISDKAPAAKAIIGKHVSDCFELGTTKHTIKSIE